MDPYAITALVLQTVVILGAIFVAVLKINGRLVRVETRCDHIEHSQEDAKHERDSLDSKVNGISRHVANIEGQISRCSKIT